MDQAQHQSQITATLSQPVLPHCISDLFYPTSAVHATATTDFDLLCFIALDELSDCVQKLIL
jgi:hypothetical protein